MTVLVDTHVLLWALRDPTRLSAKATAIIEDPTMPVLVSAATAWEIATKHRVGKLPGVDGLVAGFEDTLREGLLTELPVTAGHALLAGRLEWSHRDPFDRILAAQAVSERVPLITSDAAFASVPELDVVW